MAKGRTPSTSRSLASLVRNYRRLERSLLVTLGENRDLAALVERQKAIRQELKEVSAQVRARRKGPQRPKEPDDPALAALRESILLMSRNLGIPVKLD